jgi:monoamine oxidase
MSRTPLFAILRRAAALARHAHRSAQPVDEVVERAMEMRREDSRRRFLRSLGVGSAALAVAACAPRAVQAPKHGDDEVVIVGAGVAGLTAGWRLRQARVPVRIFEANTRIGGRMFSLRDHFPDGQVIELGGELIDTDHVRIRALADELGLTLDDLLTDDPSLQGDVWFANGRAYSEEELVRAFVPLTAAIDRDLATLGDGDITWDVPDNAQALDAMSVSGWLQREGAEPWLRTLIEVAYTTEMGLESDRQSALNLLTFIGTEAGSFKIFGSSDERFHVRGGNDLIVQGLGEKLADAIETSSPLEALRQEADGRYVLTFRQGSNSREVRAREVILALPFTTLRQVQLDLELPAHKRRAIENLQYGTNAKLMIGFNERVWRTQHRRNGSVFSDLPFQTTWETTRLQPGASGALTNFTGGRHGVELGEGSAKMQADKAARELDAIFPGIAAARDGAREVRMHWPTQPWAQGSYACLTTGDWTSLRGAMGESVGQLHFAGEHCALDTQGFMEGGCESGEAAAAQVLAQRGLASALATMPKRVRVVQAIRDAHRVAASV